MSTRVKKPKTIHQKDWDAVGSPALDDAILAHMRPAKDVLPAAFLKAVAEGRVGRPKSPKPKRAVSLRLDADVVEAYRVCGKGWQTRINALLREHMPR
jgi:uncharacterized protein (DUF4415 family)